MKYLASYTHRVAISNQRLIALEEGQVAFHYKDYRHGRPGRVMRLSAVEFMRRFLQHVLPHGFVRIRHYGLLANRRCKENLQRCRLLLDTDTQSEATPASATDPIESRERLCPCCKKAPMLIVATLPPSRAGPRHAA